MLLTSLLQANDSCLGRVDHSSLSDQTLMEMLFKDLPDKATQKFKDQDGFYLDVCQWRNITCDDEGNVVRIRKCDAVGSVAFAHIPPKVKIFHMSLAGIVGTIEACDLPQRTEEFDVGDNKLEGTFDFANSPVGIRELSIYKNNFSGGADLENLPKPMTHLWIHDNKFSGSLCLTNLPPKFQTLDASRNAFSGSFCIQNAPLSLRYVCADGNWFSPTAVIPHLCEAVHLCHSGVTAVISAAGNTHPDEEEILS